MEQKKQGDCFLLMGVLEHSRKYYYTYNLSGLFPSTFDRPVMPCCGTMMVFDAWTVICCKLSFLLCILSFSLFISFFIFCSRNVRSRALRSPLSSYFYDKTKRLNWAFSLVPRLVSRLHLWAQPTPKPVEGFDGREQTDSDEQRKVSTF